MSRPNALVDTFIFVTRAGDDIENEIVKVTGVKGKGFLLVKSLDGIRSGKFSNAEQKRVISGYEGEDEDNFANVLADSKRRNVTKPPIFMKKSDDMWLKLNNKKGKLDVPQEWSSEDESNSNGIDYSPDIGWDKHKKNLDEAMVEFERWLEGGDEAPSGAGGAATTSGGTGGEGDPTSSGAGGNGNDAPIDDATMNDGHSDATAEGNDLVADMNNVNYLIGWSEKACDPKSTKYITDGRTYKEKVKEIVVGQTEALKDAAGVAVVNRLELEYSQQFATAKEALDGEHGEEIQTIIAALAKNKARLIDLEERYAEELKQAEGQDEEEGGGGDDEEEQEGEGGSKKKPELEPMTASLLQFKRELEKKIEEHETRLREIMRSYTNKETSLRTNLQNRYAKEKDRFGIAKGNGIMTTPVKTKAAYDKLVETEELRVKCAHYDEAMASATATASDEANPRKRSASSLS